MTVGGCSFVHDPDIPITRKSVIWRRQDTTRIISLTDAPRGFTDLRSLDFEATVSHWPCVRTSRWSGR
ncbi:hypothetical protein [Acetobacter okinawensis]|uniref:hypothetical protein n=1 Tax=Acetobacter okinawensis TaxID=1076594 RepID=UPI00209CED03|nr:hypothetical protein [Acetobacter okinawensis]MCP1213987.1 hypothetical protein [Acetobacter okinawensis]